MSTSARGRPGPHRRRRIGPRQSGGGPLSPDAISTGSRQDLEHRLHGQSQRRDKNGVSPNSEPWAPSFGRNFGTSNFGRAMDDPHDRHPIQIRLRYPPRAHPRWGGRPSSPPLRVSNCGGSPEEAQICPQERLR